MDTSDLAYEKRHRRYERVEKSGRLRDVERLQNKQYHLHERLEQLKSIDSTAFLTYDKSCFHGPALEDEDAATVNNRALATGIAETREGERRRRQMLRTGLALEARLKASLKTRKKKGAYNASPSRRTNGASQHATTSSLPPSSMPDDTTDAFVLEVLAPIPQQPRLTVKKPYYPGLMVDDDQDSDYQDVYAEADVDERDEWYDAAIQPPKKRRRSGDDDFYDDGYKPAAKKKLSKLTPRVKDFIPTPRGAEQAMPSFKIKIPAPTDPSRVSTPTLAKGKGRSLETPRPQLPIPTHPSLPMSRNLARPLDAIRHPSLSPMTSIDETEDEHASRVHHHRPLNHRSPTPPRTIYTIRQPMSQPIPITPRRRSRSPSRRSHDGPFPLPPPPPPSSTKKRKAEEIVVPRNSKKQKVQDPDAPPKRGPGRPRKEGATPTPVAVIPPTPAPMARRARSMKPEPTPQTMPEEPRAPTPREATPQLPPSLLPTPTPQPATPAAGSSTSRRSVTRGPEAKKKDGVLVTAARNSGKGGRAPRHLTAFGAVMPAALAKDPKVWGPETTNYQLPWFITNDPMVETGMARIEEAFDKRHR